MALVSCHKNSFFCHWRSGLHQHCYFNICVLFAVCSMAMLIPLIDSLIDRSMSFSRGSVITVFDDKHFWTRN